MFSHGMIVVIFFGLLPMSAMYFMHLKLQCLRYMCIHQQKIIVWRHPSCHLCKYFTTMRKMVLDFDYSPLSCSYLCCVLGYCCTVLYRKSFRYDQSDTHTRTHKEDSITLIYTWERNRERLSFTVQCFALLWRSLFTSQIFHHWCTLLLFISVSQPISTGIVYSSLRIAPFCVLFVLILGIKTHLFRTILQSKEWRRRINRFHSIQLFFHSVRRERGRGIVSLCVQLLHVSCLIFTFQNEKVRSWIDHLVMAWPY